MVNGIAFPNEISESNMRIRFRQTGIGFSRPIGDVQKDLNRILKPYGYKLYVGGPYQIPIYDYTKNPISSGELDDGGFGPDSWYQVEKL